MSDKSWSTKFLRKLGVPQGAEVLVLTFGFVGLLLLGMGAYWVGEKIRVASGGMPDDAYIVTKWDGDAAIGVDVNGDGVEDVVGMYAGKGPGGIYFGAFNGKDGKILWRIGPLSQLYRPMGGGQPQFGRQNDLILINQQGKGVVLGLKDGKKVGDVALPSGRLVCAGPTVGSPLIVATSLAEENLRVDLATRHVEPLAGRQPCSRTMARSRFLDTAGLTAPNTLQFAAQDGSDIAAISVDASKSVVVHGYVPGKNDPTWSVPLDKQSLTAGDARALDIAKGRIFLGYFQATPGKNSVVALDAKTGREVWRVPVDAPGQI